MTLLDTLKQMKEVGWEFEQAGCEVDWPAGNDGIGETTFWIKGVTDEFNLPTIQEVEDAVVEMIDIPKDCLEIIIGVTNSYRIHRFIEFGHTEYLHNSEHKDRLTAVCQLWIKLKEVNS